MKVAIVGGGPSGLYLAILLKRRRPGWNVGIVEQNQPGFASLRRTNFAKASGLLTSIKPRRV